MKKKPLVWVRLNTSCSVIPIILFHAEHILKDENVNKERTRMISGLEPPYRAFPSHVRVPNGERHGVLKGEYPGDLSPLFCSFSPTLCRFSVFSNSAVSSGVMFSK